MIRRIEASERRAEVAEWEVMHLKAYSIFRKSAEARHFAQWCAGDAARQLN
jgi:hypothetical protein